MGKIIHTSQDLILAVERQIKLLGKQFNARVIGATIDWKNLDATPYEAGFFDRVQESVLEITLPMKILTENGARNSAITIYMGAFTVMGYQQYYMANPHYSRESPKRYMFTQDDFRHEVLSFLSENLDFDNCFYIVQGSPKMVKQIDLQESFELNVHSLLAPTVDCTFPFIAASNKDLEALFMIYYGYWLHNQLMVSIIQQNIHRYRQKESRLLTPCPNGVAPYTGFKSQMDDMFHSAFYTIEGDKHTPPRKYKLVYKQQGTECYLFLSAYVSVCVNVATGKPTVIHHVGEMSHEQAIQRVETLGIASFTQLINSYYT